MNLKLTGNAIFKNEGEKNMIWFFALHINRFSLKQILQPH
ncbi:hypothetical protein HDEF_1627 [Candidatus Hamiltonella defensa 5AT (Acyrthosiphon pisum)]|uniref:Uncharacterized protein n=1 Tax=Hamiltonella defensa subsp. Acyrthosiphon pisum (strain 5AT) TaxID=572265 RepID=C4K6P6_HAMD5|nr:hypothetical protein HDEF_1627 [Candidatus Hamiltonella defensa 5AT (Acyrthosiphon pisum)]